MRYADESGVLELIRSLLGSGDSGHPHLLGYYQILDIVVSLSHVFITNNMNIYLDYLKLSIYVFDIASMAT